MVARSGSVTEPGLQTQASGNLISHASALKECRGGRGRALTGDCMMRSPHRWVNAVAVGMDS